MAKYGTPFKMNGFSGFGNSPLKEKATVKQKIKAASKAMLGHMVMPHKTLGLKPGKNIWESYKIHKASAKQYDKDEARKKYEKTDEYKIKQRERELERLTKPGL
jgi:hypothetical protein